MRFEPKFAVLKIARLAAIFNIQGQEVTESKRRRRNGSKQEVYDQSGESCQPRGIKSVVMTDFFVLY